MELEELGGRIKWKKEVKKEVKIEKIKQDDLPVEEPQQPPVAESFNDKDTGSFTRKLNDHNDIEFN